LPVARIQWADCLEISPAVHLLNVYFYIIQPIPIIMTQFNEHYLAITHDASVPCVIMQWKSFATSQEFRKGLNSGLHMVNTHKVGNWLADLRKMDVIDPEDEQWSNTDWFPRALQAGIRKMALIPSEDVFNNMAVENIMSQVTSNLQVHYFKDLESAKAWLKGS
jgi:hypothetical protein